MLIVNITSLVIHLHFGINDSIRNSHKFLIVGGGETLVDRENQSLVLMLQSTFTKPPLVRGASKQVPSSLLEGLSSSSENIQADYKAEHPKFTQTNKLES